MIVNRRCSPFINYNSANNIGGRRLVRMKIVYDLLGREVIRLINDELRSAGSHTIKFDGSNLSSGIYFMKIQAGDFVATKKMVLVK